MAKKTNKSTRAKLVAIRKTQTAANTDARFQNIARAAYLRTQSRDYVPGSEIEDWLEAQREIDAMSAGSV